MANDKVCPEEDELSKFSAGKLPSEQIAKIGEHVETCDECANTLSLLSDKSDTVVAGIRDMQQAGQYSEADRQRVVQLAANVRSSDLPEHDTSKPVEIPAELRGMVTDIQQARLLTEEQINVVIESLPIEKRSDVQDFAKALIRSGSLTKFQATAIYQRKAKSLVFGEYVVLDKIGAGGMGMVYRAQHRRMKREVAIKVLPGGSLDDEDAVNRFYQEVEAAAKLLHPNIVAAFDAGQHGKSHYLVMEYVEGNDLSELIKSKGPLPVPTAVNLMIQAARGLEYAHGEGLVHRDIKPANLLVDNKGTVKILDMGLARFTNTGVTDHGLTKSGQIMGTVDYMAPEQATDTRRADARADIYSLGCTLYRLLTGTPMFEGETIMNKMMAHATEMPPDLRVSRPEVLDQLNAMFQKMVAKSPDQRQQSMTEIITDLTACLSDESMQPAPLHQSPGANETSSDSQLTDFFGGIDPADPHKKGQATAVLEQTIDEQPSEVDGTISKSDLSRAPKPAPAPQKQKSRRGLFIGLTMVGILALLGGMVIYLQGPDGTVRIEILDPKLDVVVNSTGAVIKGDKKFEKIKLVPGKDKLKIIRDGFEFFTDDFELKKGKDVVIRVEYVKGKVKVVKDGVTLSVNEAKPNATTAPPLAIAPFDENQAKAHQKAWGDYLGLPVEKEVELPGGEKMVFMLIPPGEFMMGSTNEEQAQLLKSAKNDDDLASLDRIPEELLHQVRITKPFYLGKYEVTQAQWQAVTAENPSTYKDNTELPVETVSWYDVHSFMEKLNESSSAGKSEFALPTEAQWEYSCRAGTTTFWHFGNSEADLNEYGWLRKGTAPSRTRQVGRLKPNAFGLYDMHGNVWEWCVDRYAKDYYKQAPLNDPPGPSSGTGCVVRGGSWYDYQGAAHCRSAFRNVHRLENRRLILGFRLAMTIDSVKIKASPTPDPDGPPLAIAPFDEKQAKQHQQAWAKYLGTTVETANNLGLKLRLIPPGEFFMGTSQEQIDDLVERAQNPNWNFFFKNEGPQHKVILTKSYYIGTHEVTQSQWREVMGNNPAHFSAGGKGKETVTEFDTSKFPIEMVSWFDAVEFCNQLSKREKLTPYYRTNGSQVSIAGGNGYRLPTEAEWEFACRAGTTTRWSFGDVEQELAGSGWFHGNASGHTHNVGELSANAFGLHDTHGNVFEWCQDWYSTYDEETISDPIGPARESRRVLRGGSFNNNLLFLRSAHRDLMVPAARQSRYGFRVARTIDMAKLRSLPTQTEQVSPTEILTSPDWEWAEPVNLGPVINSEENELGATLSADGLTLLFNRTVESEGEERRWELWRSKRPAVDDDWSAPVNITSQLVGVIRVQHTSLSDDRLTLLFTAGHPDRKRNELWMSQRKRTSDDWSSPVNLGAAINTLNHSAACDLSSDELTLIYTATRTASKGNFGSSDLWQSTRRAKDGSWQAPTNLGPVINSRSLESTPRLSRDGRTLLFASNRPDGKGHADLWLSTRTSADAPWTEPVRLGPPINTPRRGAGSPALSGDGRILIFASNRTGGQGGEDLWMSRRVRKKSGQAAVPPLAVAPFDKEQAKQHQKRWADYLGLPIEKEIELPGGEKMAFMLIPPGEFMMGSSDEERDNFLREAKTDNDTYVADRVPSEGPQHLVGITQPFYLGKYEVTHDQWVLLMGKGPWNRFSNGTQPVTQTTWDQIQSFLAKLNTDDSVNEMKFALPTEAQWEYACRAGTTNYWGLGDSESALNEYAWFLENSGGKIHPVGQRKPNAFGLHDMYGSICEWCSDWYSDKYYERSPKADPRGPLAGSERVFRGGGWGSAARNCRPAIRQSYTSASGGRYLGFRLAMMIDTTKLPQANAKDDGVDLLSLIDPKRDGVVGEWSKPKDLVGHADDDKDSYMWLQVPYIPPEEYDLNLVVDPGKNGALVIGLVTSHGRFRVAVDRYTNGKGTKRHTTFGDPAANWDGRLLKPSEQNDVRFQLRTDGLRIVVNGEQIVDWKGDFSASEYREIGLYKTPNPRCLVVGSGFDPLHVYSMQLVPVTGTGEQLQQISKK